MFHFADDVLEQLAAQDDFTAAAPCLVCWYSGGFKQEPGNALLVPFLKAAEKAGIKKHLVLDHHNEYAMKGPGIESYPVYIDKCVEEIDRVAKGRPLLLFAHSRGCVAASGVASRLGRRVLKVYVVASQGSVAPGLPTSWEKLAKRFQAGTDQAMLGWFARLQPGNFLLERAAAATDDQYEAMRSSSSFLTDLVDLLDVQYRYGMWPDMKNGTIDVFPADIWAIAPATDPMCHPDSLEGYRKLTSGRCEILTVDGSHMGCLGSEGSSKPCELHEKVCADMVACWENQELQRWSSRLLQIRDDSVFGRLVFLRAMKFADNVLARAIKWVEANPFADPRDIEAQKACVKAVVEIEH